MIFENFGLQVPLHTIPHPIPRAGIRHNSTLRYCSVLQCVAVCLLCVAMCCSGLQLNISGGNMHNFTLRYCSVLQCVAVCCHVL